MNRLVVVASIFLFLLSTKLSTGMASPSSSGVIDLFLTESPAKVGSQDSPTTLLVHGLDSSSTTWSTVMSRMTTPTVAVDVRGSGRSPLGDRDSFSRDNIVDDIKRVVERHPLLHGRSAGKARKPFVLLGHSMGGRIVSCYAAKYPADVAALIIEDMDIKQRTLASSPIPLDPEKVRGFNRDFSSREDAIRALTGVGYREDAVERWLTDGRIRPVDGSDDKYWSDVNPDFRALRYQHFCDNHSGEDTWANVASQTTYSFPCHVMVAAAGETVCDEQSVKNMQDIMGDRLSVHRYPSATHSIHNSAGDEFLEALERVIHSAYTQSSDSAKDAKV